MEKAGEGVSGHGDRGGEGLGDGVLGLIWSGFLLSGSRYILHFCLRSFFSFALQRVFFVSLGWDFWCLYISVFILRVCPSLLVFLMFTMALRLCTARIGGTRRTSDGAHVLSRYVSAMSMSKKKFTSYILCILRLSFGPKHVLDNCWKIWNNWPSQGLSVRALLSASTCYVQGRGFRRFPKNWYSCWRPCTEKITSDTCDATCPVRGGKR